MSAGTSGLTAQLEKGLRDGYTASCSSLVALGDPRKGGHAAAHGSATCSCLPPCCSSRHWRDESHVLTLPVLRGRSSRAGGVQRQWPPVQMSAAFIGSSRYTVSAGYSGLHHGGWTGGYVLVGAVPGALSAQVPGSSLIPRLSWRPPWRATRLRFVGLSRSLSSARLCGGADLRRRFDYHAQPDQSVVLRGGVCRSRRHSGLLASWGMRAVTWTQVAQYNHP